MLKLRMLEKLVTFSLLQLAIGSFSVLFLGVELSEKTVDQAVTRTSIGLDATYALIYVGCAFFAVLRYKRVLHAAAAAWPFFVIALLALLSTTWSIDPGVTLRRSVVLLGSTVYGVYLGGRYSTEEFPRVLLQSFLLLLGGSILFLMVLPSYVVDTSHATAFRGLTQHKNLFGEYMGIFLLLAITYRPRWGRLVKTGMIVLALIMLAASQSGTSVLSTAVVVAIMPLCLLLRCPRKQMVPLAVLAVSLVVVVVSVGSRQIDAVLDLLGKDRTLTGRSVIWEMVLQAIGRRPWLGYGFDAFWQGLKGESLPIIAAAGWLVPHSHNGYLEALLGLGIVGLGVLGLCVVCMAWDGALYLRKVRGLAGFWPLGFLIYFLVHATGEPSLLTRDYLSYLLFIATSTSLSLERKRSKQHVLPILATRSCFNATIGAATMESS